jgi:peptide/nickel transport system substrate-binding protein
VKKEKAFLKLTYLAISVCIVLLLLISGCGTKSTSTTAAATTTQTSKPATTKTTLTPQYGGTMVISMSADTNMIGEPSGTQKACKLMQKPAIEYLAVFDNNGNIVPWLADSWKTDPVNKTLTITIKKGIKFHDGTDFDATAVKWNLDHEVAMKKQEMQSVASIDVVDASTVRCNLKQWDSSIVYDVCWSAGGMISPTAAQAHDEAWVQQNPVGTGPFQFVSWQHDVSIVYKKFDGYWQKGKPYLDGIKFVFIPDDTTRQASFESGDTNVIFAVSPLIANTLEKENKYVETSVKNGNGTTQIMIVPDAGHATSIYANQSVRNALEYAIDKQKIVDSLFYGHAVVTNQWGPPGNFAYDPNMVGHPYNPATAKQLLASAGYPNGFSTYIMCNPQYQQSVQVIKDQFAAVNINMDIKVYDVAGLFGPISKGWDNGLLLMTVQPDGDVLSRLGWVQTGAPLMPCVLFTAQTDQMILDAKAAPDDKTKQALTWKVQDRVFGEQSVMIPLWVIDDITFRSPKVHNDGLDMIEAGQWTPQDAWMEH